MGTAERRGVLGVGSELFSQPAGARQALYVLRDQTSDALELNLAL